MEHRGDRLETTSSAPNDVAAEAMKILDLCIRKCEITGKGADYIRILMDDEIRNHLLRKKVNEISISILDERREDNNVRCMLTESLPSKMS